jgi:ribonuclease HII
MLPPKFPIKLLDDSKKLTPARRQVAYQRLVTHSEVRFGLGEASVAEIDRLNILKATFLAMERALAALVLQPDAILVDGRDFPFFMAQGEAIIDGDAQVASIAAASILAKETRDATMLRIAGEFPHYGFEAHKGYGTRQHHEALHQHGPCVHHRRSFAPVRALL